MSLCYECGCTLKSKKSNAKICADCNKQTLKSVNRVCLFCNTTFIDNSRSKNKRYCSERCNTDAGHIRYNYKVASGVVTPPRDTRDRKEERRKKYKDDVNFKLSVVLRSRLNTALKNNQKVGSAVNDLGCSIEELKSYLESRWQLDMKWDNYGLWHIDHIKPLSSFNLSDREQFLKACHFSNLQPLWAKDNLRKSDKEYMSTCVYILAGPNGCGKTYLAKTLEDVFYVLDYDKLSLKKILDLAGIPSSKPILVVTPIQAKRMMRELGELGIKTSGVYLREDIDTIISRINQRNGKVNETLTKRIKRYESLKDKIFQYYGTQEEVRQWLLDQVASRPSRSYP